MIRRVVGGLVFELGLAIAGAGSRIGGFRIDVLRDAPAPGRGDDGDLGEDAYAGHQPHPAVRLSPVAEAMRARPVVEVTSEEPQRALRGSRADRMRR